MDLIIGGAFQGKKVYAYDFYGLSAKHFIDGSNCQEEELCQCRGIYNFQEYVRRFGILAGEQALSGAPGLVIITTEVGCGIVPVDPIDRQFREKYGRLCQQLAAKAGRVHRVVCGIGMVIKGA